MDITGLADAARAASRTLAVTRRELKDAALNAMADALLAHEADLLAANAADIDAARESGTQDWMLDRLALTSKRVADMADGLRALARLAGRGDGGGHWYAGADLGDELPETD